MLEHAVNDVNCLQVITAKAAIQAPVRITDRVLIIQRDPTMADLIRTLDTVLAMAPAWTNMDNSTVKVARTDNSTARVARTDSSMAKLDCTAKAVRMVNNTDKAFLTATTIAVSDCTRRRLLRSPFFSVQCMARTASILTVQVATTNTRIWVARTAVDSTACTVWTRTLMVVAWIINMVRIVGITTLRGKETEET